MNTDSYYEASDRPVGIDSHGGPNVHTNRTFRDVMMLAAVVVAFMLLGCEKTPEEQWADMRAAVMTDDGRKIERLLRRGVDPNQMLENDMSLLCLAAYNGNQEAVQALLTGGADPTINSLLSENNFSRVMGSAKVCAHFGQQDPPNDNADYDQIIRLIEAHEPAVDNQ